MDFDMLGLAPRLLKTLEAQGISKPTPIQTQAIPHAMNGRDVMGLAQTGTGKTAAFGLPLIDKLMKAGTKPEPKSTRGLILAPTRELAKQISDNLRAYTEGTHLKVNIVVGGASIGVQINRLARGTDLLVATPGRLLDLLDRRAISLSDTNFLVLDEADQMLDLGFIHALRKIAALLPEKRQTMLFSATMPKNMAELASTYLNDPVRVEVSPPGKVADKIDQKVHFVNQAEKTRRLIDMLNTHRDEKAVVFARTKHGSERLMKALVKAGYDATSVHGNKSQGQRERAIREFRAGDVTVLVATDVAARGLDIPGVKYVYNYDLPNVAENYVHRIGRTARAGNSGSAIALCAPEEISELRDIEKTIGHPIYVASGTAPTHEAPKSRGRGGPRRGQGGGGGGGKPGGASKGRQAKGSGGGNSFTGAGKPGGSKGRRPRRSKSSRAA